MLDVTMRTPDNNPSTIFLAAVSPLAAQKMAGQADLVLRRGLKKPLSRRRFGLFMQTRDTEVEVLTDGLLSAPDIRKLDFSAKGSDIQGKVRTISDLLIGRDARAAKAKGIDGIGLLRDNERSISAVDTITGRSIEIEVLRYADDERDRHSVFFMANGIEGLGQPQGSCELTMSRQNYNHLLMDRRAAEHVVSVAVSTCSSVSLARGAGAVVLSGDAVFSRHRAFGRSSWASD